MATTHAPRGFTGTVDQVAEAQRFEMVSARFRTRGSTDWIVTAVTTSDRTVSISAGTAMACGVRDVTTSADTVQLAANSTGTTRYDAIVATFDWSKVVVNQTTGAVDTSTAVVFRAITGTTSPPQVNASTTTPNAAQINRIAGVQYDALLAVVAVNSGQGALAASSITQLTPYGGGASTIIPSSAYTNLVDVHFGGHIRVPAFGNLPERTLLKAADGTFRQVAPPVITNIIGAWYNLPASGNNDGTQVWGNDPQIIGEIAIPDLGIPYRATARAACEAGSTNANTRWDISLRLDSTSGAVLGADRGDKWVNGDSYKLYNITSVDTEVLTGAHKIYVVAGTGFKPTNGDPPALGSIGPFNRFLAATITAA